MAELLDPKAVIRGMSVEELCRTADKPFSEVTDPLPLMAKPFGNIIETPDILFNLGHLLAALRLGRTMEVVDFGAGSCWLSRCLNQLGCVTVSVDPSPAALALGKRMFRDFPPIGGSVAEPRFLPFQGRRIDLPDASVDRVVCFDSFHHVPNQEEVLSEFHRVLRPGGLAGFSEPGRHHSRSAQSQFEMRAHGVLENDIVLEEIWEAARRIGFTGMSVRPSFDPNREISLDAYLDSLAGGLLGRLSRPFRTLKTLRGHFGLLGSLAGRSIFTLGKGPFLPDSRRSFVAMGGNACAVEAADLSHRMTTERRELQARRGEELEIAVRITNAGTVTWLHRNIVDYAVVKLGGHLYDAGGALVDYDFLRSGLPSDVPPGTSITHAFPVSFPEPGEFRLVLDLVSERVAWFEAAGSRPVTLAIKVA